MNKRKNEGSINKKNKEYVGQSETTLTLQNHWTINLKFQKRINSSPVLSELNIRMLNENSINTSFLQSLNLGEIIKSGLKDINEAAKESDDYSYAIKIISNKQNWKNLGNKPHPDINYACTAFVYHYLIVKGTPNVLKELCKISNLESTETIKKRISEAKERKFLIAKKNQNSSKMSYAVTKKCMDLIKNSLNNKKEKK